MHEEGFEPSSIATPHLECGPLDRSGIRASRYSSHVNLFITLTKKDLSCLD
jgi:hypothetical protein